MPHFYRTALLVLTLGCFLSCDPCRNLDCFASSYTGQFRIVNKTDGSDLLFGPGSNLHADEIVFYSLSGTDTAFFPSEAIRFSGNGYDSVLLLNFSPGKEVVYMKLNNLDTDTLQLDYKTKATRCCGNTTTISNFKLHNTVNLGSNDSVSVIRK